MKRELHNKPLHCVVARHAPRRSGAPRSVMYTLSILLPLLLLAQETRAQKMETKEIGVQFLDPAPQGLNPGLSTPRVSWHFNSTVARKENVSCDIETERINEAWRELVFRLTDNGGIGDTACDLKLQFDSLKNFYLFSGVGLEVDDCGNPPCETAVVTSSGPDKSSFNVVVRGKMKGAWLKSTARFRVRLRVRGPRDFSPFDDQPKPDLWVSRIESSSALAGQDCPVTVTLSNLWESNWVAIQGFAYNSNPAAGVIISLRKDGLDCQTLTGNPATSSPVTLSQFDPNRTLDQANKPVLFTWPVCGLRFGETAKFTATIDVGDRLVEFQRKEGKSKIVTLKCTPPAIKKP
jgi:hypothetical protein